MQQHRFNRRHVVSTSLGILAGSKMILPTHTLAQSTPDAESRTVTDYLNRDVEIPTDPQRVITLSLPILEIALSVGITPVGSASFATLNGFPEPLAERAEGIELVGDVEWDFEKIISLEPDIAVLDYFDKDAEGLAILEQIVPVVTVGEFRTEWRQDSAAVADALNRREEFREIEERYDSRVAELKKKLTPDWAGKTVAVLRFRAADMRILKNISFAATVLADLDLSFPDIADSGHGVAEDFSMEQAQLIDVDALFIVHDSGTDAEENFRSAFESPVFQLLDVVKRGNVYLVDQETWITLRGYGASEVLFNDIERFLVNGEPGLDIDSH